MKKLLPVILVLFFATLSAQNSLQHLSSTTGGASYDIIYVNGYVYTGAGNTMMVHHLDANGIPDTMVYEYRFGSHIDDMQLKGNKLFVAANHAGLAMLDVSSPAAPSLLDIYEPDSLNEAAYHIAFSGDSVFVAYRTKMALFFDAGSSLNLLNRFAYQPGNSVIRGCAVKGNLLAFTCAYGTNPQTGVSIYNVNSLSPISFYTQNYCDPEGVEFGKNTNLLHVLGGTASYGNPFDANGLFYSLNISNPATPIEVFRDTLPGILGLAIAQPMNADNVNDTIFVSAQCALDTNFNLVQDSAAGMIYVYDAINPSNVHWITTLNGGLWNFDCDVVGNRVYIASEWYGIKTLDITNIHNDIFLGYYRTGGWNLGSDIYGDQMFVGNEGFGFKKFDISDPQNPDYVAQSADPGFCMNMKYSSDGQYVYGFYWTYDRFRVMDTSTLAVVGSIPSNAGDKDIWVYGDKVVSISVPSIGNKEIFVTDVSAPATPFVDTTWVINDIKDILLNSTGKVFVARRDSMMVYDLNNNMNLLTSIAVPTPFWNDWAAIAEYNDTIYAYVSGLISPGLYKYVYNGSNQLTFIASYTTVAVQDPARMMMAADSFGLYVSDINLGLYAYNKNTLVQTGYYRHGMEFVVNFQWGPQELRCKDGLIILVEYMGQTSLFTNDPGYITNADVIPLAPTNAMVLYPNPADDHVFISSNDNVESVLVIYDLSGKEIYRDEHYRANAAISTLVFAEGTYIAELVADNEIMRTRFLISR